MRSLLVTLAFVAVATGPAAAQQVAVADSGLLTVDRIYTSREFLGSGIGLVKWLPEFRRRYFEHWRLRDVGRPRVQGVRHLHRVEPAFLHRRSVGQ